MNSLVPVRLRCAAGMPILLLNRLVRSSKPAGSDWRLLPLQKRGIIMASGRAFRYTVERPRRVGISLYPVGGKERPYSQLGLKGERYEQTNLRAAGPGIFWNDRRGCPAETPLGEHARGRGQSQRHDSGVGRAYEGRTPSRSRSGSGWGAVVHRADDKQAGAAGSEDGRVQGISVGDGQEFRAARIGGGQRGQHLVHG